MLMSAGHEIAGRDTAGPWPGEIRLSLEQVAAASSPEKVKTVLAVEGRTLIGENQFTWATEGTPTIGSGIAPPWCGSRSRQFAALTVGRGRISDVRSHR